MKRARLQQWQLILCQDPPPALQRKKTAPILFEQKFAIMVKVFYKAVFCPSLRPWFTFNI